MILLTKPATAGESSQLVKHLAGVSEARCISYNLKHLQAREPHVAESRSERMRACVSEGLNEHTPQTIRRPTRPFGGQSSPALDDAENGCGLVKSAVFCVFFLFSTNGRLTFSDTGNSADVLLCLFFCFF